ncbi:MAG: hypothetical protein ACRD3A_12410 [Terriglobales bacterium]
MSFRTRAAVVLMAVLVFLPAPAEQRPQAPRKHVRVPSIAHRPEDVGSIDGIMKAYYEVISGPAGQARQWSRDRTLYIPGVRFVAMSESKDGKPVAEVVDHQAYVDRTDPIVVREGFDEREIHRITHRFGNIGHVFSTYESRRTADGPVIGRGINSLELYWDGKRWWIAANIWDQERADNPIPKEYLP